MQQHILIYRDWLVPNSQRFVVNQAESVPGFLPWYIGSRRVPGGCVPADRHTVLNEGSLFGRLTELAFKGAGAVPPAFARLSRLHPVLLHAHFGPDGVLALPVAQKLNLPLVVTFHGFDATVRDEALRTSGSRVQQLYVRRRHRLMASGDLFIGVSRYIVQKLLDAGFPPESVIHHYLGVDVDWFSPDPAVARTPTVLFVGRLVPVKGCEYLLRAMSRVQAEYPAAELVVLGDGPLRAQLVSLADELGLRAQFPGAVSPAEVRAWMNRSSVFCVPSVTTETGAAEALGLVFAEAAAMKLPVVSSNSGGISEVVRHGETGYLAPERDHQQLAAHILALLENAALRTEMGESARRAAVDRFNHRLQAQALAAIYDRLLDGRR